MSSPNVFRILDDHFNRLDAHEISPQSIFRRDSDKQRYETILTYSFRKYQASKYHLSRVGELIKRDTELLNNTRPVEVPESTLPARAKIYRTKKSFVKTADEYCFEFSAFLAGLKSSLDFLAEACSRYLTGTKTNYSISPLLKSAKKGRKGPIFDQIRSHSDWLAGLREYRDYLVHRLVISTHTGHTIETMGDKSAKVYFPAMVPETTPSFTPDTRSVRMNSEGVRDRDDLALDGIDIDRSITEVTDSEGAKTLVDFTIAVSASPGYKPMDEFMSKHLASFEVFFEEMIKTLDSFSFRE